MDALLHFLGICPDSLSHPDALNLVIYYYNEILELLKAIKFKFGI